MEKITAEERCRIFASYWGAEVLHPANGQHSMNIQRLSSDLVGANGAWLDIKDCQLLLTELSAISDSDAIEVAKIIHYDESLINSESGFSWVRAFNKGVSSYVSTKNWTIAVDYLRSKSYNLGFGPYSPQDLKDLGIVKSL